MTLTQLDRSGSLELEAPEMVPEVVGPIEVIESVLRGHHSLMKHAFLQRDRRPGEARGGNWRLALSSGSVLSHNQHICLAGRRRAQDRGCF